jgi:hypothetical protein
MTNDIIVAMTNDTFDAIMNDTFVVPYNFFSNFFCNLVTQHDVLDKEYLQININFIKD